jgi:endonuclease YncB( thermonuclease family)
MPAPCARPRRSLAAVVLGALLLSLLTVVASSPAHAADKDCGDFGTQKQAQDFFLDAGGPSSDPHQLDADGDGIACETNPCPCSTSTSGGGGTSTGGGTTKQIRQTGKVYRVVDGDTIEVRLANGRLKDVRLVGIDTPEVYGGVECAGPEASASLKRLLPKGTRVRMLSDTSQDAKDRYGRLLRYVVKVSSGKDMNRAQIQRGWARVYVYADNPFNRVTSYRKAQTSARDASRGLWGLC